MWGCTSRLCCVRSSLSATSTRGGTPARARPGAASWGVRPDTEMTTWVAQRVHALPETDGRSWNRPHGSQQHELRPVLRAVRLGTPPPPSRPEGSRRVAGPPPQHDGGLSPAWLWTALLQTAPHPRRALRGEGSVAVAGRERPQQHQLSPVCLRRHATMRLARVLSLNCLFSDRYRALRCRWAGDVQRMCSRAHEKRQGAPTPCR